MLCGQGLTQWVYYVCGTSHQSHLAVLGARFGIKTFSLPPSLSYSARLRRSSSHVQSGVRPG